MASDPMAGSGFDVLSRGCDRSRPQWPVASGIEDSHGGYYFRNRWHNNEDVIVYLGTDSLSDSKGWDEADAQMLNIMGFGTRFCGGPGSSGNDELFSQLTVNGLARNDRSHTGSNDFFQADADGGYAIAGGGGKLSGIGLTDRSGISW